VRNTHSFVHDTHSLEVRRYLAFCTRIYLVSIMPLNTLIGDLLSFQVGFHVLFQGLILKFDLECVLKLHFQVLGSLTIHDRK
jgi:hypothetical protein